MLTRVKTVLSRLTANSSGVTAAGQQGRSAVREEKTKTEGADSATPPYLFNGPACDQVYIASEKGTCGTCDVAVERLE